MRHKEVAAKCTLNPNDISGVGDQPMSRRKSFKKSLRESFRRLRKGRSQRAVTTPKSNPASPLNKTQDSSTQVDLFDIISRQWHISSLCFLANGTVIAVNLFVTCI